jgi:cytoskeletal protein RodZ
MESVEKVRNLEAELAASRKQAAKSLRTERNRLGLTLRQVSSRIRMTPAAIHNIELSKSWKTRTAQKLARFYSNAA